MENSKEKCIEKVRHPSDFIRKAVALMENQITRDNISRHSEFIKSYVQHSPNGVILSDLYYLMRVLDMITNRISENPIYCDLLKELLTIVSMPPQMTKASDVLTYARDFQEYFSSLGVDLVSLNGELQIMLLDVLKNLIQKPAKSKEFVTQEMRIKALEKSQLPDMLANYLVLADGDIYYQLLELTDVLQKLSRECCKKFLLQNTLNTVIMRLSPEWKIRAENFNTEQVKICNIIINLNEYEKVSSLCWALIAFAKGNRQILTDVEIVHRIALWSARDAFKYFVTSKQQSIQRNDILAIIVELMILFPTMDFVSSGLAKDIASISIFDWYGFRRHWALEVPLASYEDDYLFYKLLLMSFPYFLNFEGGREVLEDVGAMTALLYHLQDVDFPKPFSRAHRCLLNLYSWNIIKKLAPQLEEDFIENVGPNIMLQCLKKHDDYVENLLILNKCLDALNYILKHEKSDAVRKSLIFNQGVQISLGLAESFLNRRLNIHSQKCLTLLFALMRKLNPYDKEVVQHVVDLVVSYMKKFLMPLADDTVCDEKIIFYIVGLIWGGIIESEEFTEKFLKMGGVYHLLDILEKFPFLIRYQILGLLADLCEDSSSVPYLLTWKKNNKTFLPLLMEIFREEENKAEVKRGPSGQILDTKYPLMGKAQWIQTYCEEYNFKWSPTLADMFLSCRPRIYAILILLNERHPEAVKHVKEQYQIKQDLSAEDQVTMLVAENYFALKIFEAWNEIFVEFERASFVPIPSDEMYLKGFMEKMSIWIKELEKGQIKILIDDEIRQMAEERNLYNELCQARVANALSSLTELKFLARCTERLFRISQKHIQQNQIRYDHSSCLGPFKTTISETFMAKLKVTSVFSQTVELESNIKKEKSEIPLPISTTDSMEDLDPFSSECYETMLSDHSDPLLEQI